jgi:hypothetical protein
VPVWTSPESLVLHLRSYGEEALAARVGIYPERDERELRKAVPAGGRTQAGTIAELARTIAARKRLAGLFRSRHMTEQEAPRDVFRAATDKIARHFEASGWKYAPSGPHLSRQQARFTSRIELSTSTNNAAGALVVLQVYVGIRSRQLKKWRAQQRPPVRRDDGVAAGPLGNLSSEAKWLDWNLADRGQRASTIRDVVSHIEDLALPWFEAFAEGRPPTGNDYLGNLGEEIARAVSAYGLTP